MRNAESLGQSSKISEGLNPRKAAGSVLILCCPGLSCPVFALSCSVLHYIGQTLERVALFGQYTLLSLEIFVVLDEMNVSVGSVGHQEANTFHCHVLHQDSPGNFCWALSMRKSYLHENVLVLQWFAQSTVWN